MKKTLLMSLLIAPLFAQDAGSGKIQFEKEVHDFGKIERGAKVDTSFKFTNVGKGTLEIKDVSTSCGCTSAKPEKTTYAPGETGVIPVTFNSGKFKGPIEKRITVVTNDTSNPRAVVSIKADIMVDISVKPPSVYIPRLKRTEQITKEITITADQLDALELTNLVSDQPFITAKLEKVDDKNSKLLMSVDGSKAPKGANRLHGVVRFNTNSKTQSEIAITLNAMVENAVSVNPKAIYLFGTKEGQGREVTIKVWGTEGEKLELTDVAFDVTLTAQDGKDIPSAEHFKSEVLPETDDTSNVRVMVSDKIQKGRFEGTIVLKTNNEEMPEVKIPIRGNVL